MGRWLPNLSESSGLQRHRSIERSSHNIFRGKKRLEANFPSRGKVINFPQAIRTPFSQTLHFMGKLAILREKESYFQEKTIPQRENLPSEGKLTQFPIGGKVLPQKLFMVL